MLDSGSEPNVANINKEIRDHPIQESDGRRKGLKYKTAGGTITLNDCEFKLQHHERDAVLDLTPKLHGLHLDRDNEGGQLSLDSFNARRGAEGRRSRKRPSSEPSSGRAPGTRVSSTSARADPGAPAPNESRAAAGHGRAREGLDAAPVGPDALRHAVALDLRQRRLKVLVLGEPPALAHENGSE